MLFNITNIAVTKCEMFAYVRLEELHIVAQLTQVPKQVHLFVKTFVNFYWDFIITMLLLDMRVNKTFPIGARLTVGNGTFVTVFTRMERHVRQERFKLGGTVVDAKITSVLAHITARLVDSFTRVFYRTVTLNQVNIFKKLQLILNRL
uniref:Uncharacterized protein n=1 Tax=Cacopsylla melanoneura TaxID=428564 RepID=A0A8D8XTB4_9HEMI